MDMFLIDSFPKAWASFCDADYGDMGMDCDEFISAAESGGLIELVPVDDDALEDAFAEERGIIPGGMMRQLTDKGRARYQKETKQ